MSKPDPQIIDHLIDIASGEVQIEEADREKRQLMRCDHDGLVALVQMTPEGPKSIPTIVRCKNISPGGMCVVSQYMLHAGYEGAVLMQRSDGEEVIIGVKVVHCRYVGEIRHEAGIEFIELPVDFSMEDFRDTQGNMPRLNLSEAA